MKSSSFARSLAGSALKNSNLQGQVRGLVSVKLSADRRWPHMAPTTLRQLRSNNVLCSAKDSSFCNNQPMRGFDAFALRAWHGHRGPEQERPPLEHALVVGGEAVALARVHQQRLEAGRGGAGRPAPGAAVVEAVPAEPGAAPACWRASSRVRLSTCRWWSGPSVHVKGKPSQRCA